MELVLAALGGVLFLVLVGFGEICLLRSIYRCPKCGEEDREGMLLAVEYSLSTVNTETAIPVYCLPTPRAEARQCKRCGGML